MRFQSLELSEIEGIVQDIEREKEAGEDRLVRRSSLSLTNLPQKRRGRGRDWQPLRLARLQCYLGRRINLSRREMRAVAAYVT